MNNAQGFRFNRVGSMALPMKKNGQNLVASLPPASPAESSKQRKSKVIPYKELRDLYYFRCNGRVFLKIGASHAIDQRTGKDAILHLNDKVVPLYRAAADVVF